MSFPEVPMVPIGPGQVARATIQVIGRAGPVYNPMGIRYLPLSQAASVGAAVVPRAGMAASSLALGAAQLLSMTLGIANVGLGLATLAQTYRIHRELQEVSEKLDQVLRATRVIDAKLDVALDALDRVENRLEEISEMVAENQLDENLTYLLVRAVRDDYIDLAVLGLIRETLDNFAKQVPNAGTYGFRPDLTLSPKTRGLLEACTKLLYGARATAWSAHNVRVGSDPAFVLSDATLLQPYAFLAQETAILLASRAATRREAPVLAARVHKYWKPEGSDKGDRKKYTRWFLKRTTNTETDLASASSIALADDIEPAIPAGMNPDTFTYSYLQQWQERCHAALLWRLRVELDAMHDSDSWAEVGRVLQDDGETEYQVTATQDLPSIGADQLPTTAQTEPAGA